MIISQTAINSVINSIRNGDNSHVNVFFSVRPEWQEEEQTSLDELTPEEIEEMWRDWDARHPGNDTTDLSEVLANKE